MGVVVGVHQNAQSASLMGLDVTDWWVLQVKLTQVWILCLIFIIHWLLQIWVEPCVSIRLADDVLLLAIMEFLNQQISLLAEWTNPLDKRFRGVPIITPCACLPILSILAYKLLQLVLHFLLFDVQDIAVRQILFLNILMLLPRFLQGLISPFSHRWQLRFDSDVLLIEDEFTVLVKELHLTLLPFTYLEFHISGHFRSISLCEVVSGRVSASRAVQIVIGVVFELVSAQYDFIWFVLHSWSRIPRRDYFAWPSIMSIRFQRWIHYNSDFS